MSQVALLVDALVPGAPRVVVRVQVREGRAVATLHDSVVRGLVPGGVDDVAAGTEPALRQVVPGLAVRASDVTEGPDQLPADPADPGAVAVRVAVPGGEDAVVHVSLLGPTGAVELPAGIADVKAGSVVDVPVTGVADGAYGAVVEADVPVVAGAVVGRAVEGSELAGTPDGVAADVPPAELAWSAATDPISLAVVSLPQGVDAELVLTAPDDAGQVSVSAVDAKGVPGTADAVAVPAGSTVSVPLAKAAALLLAPQGGAVHAAISLEVDDRNGPMVSVLPVDAPAPSVQTRRPVVERPELGLEPQPGRPSP
jgi:hypothetical protein